MTHTDNGSALLGGASRIREMAPGDPADAGHIPHLDLDAVKARFTTESSRGTDRPTAVARATRPYYRRPQGSKARHFR